jgi:Domain of unknown function (DUF4279)
MTAHPAVTRTWATLRISGDRLDPDNVTTRLGIAPSRSHKAGDRHGEQGRMIWKHGQWSLTSQGVIESTDLELHIEWLLDRIEPMHEKLQEITQQPDVTADIFCFWESESVNAGIDLAPSLMGRVASLRLSLGLDIYFAF